MEVTQKLQLGFSDHSYLFKEENVKEKNLCFMVTEKFRPVNTPDKFD
jgi:hypothetical protein